MVKIRFSLVNILLIVLLSLCIGSDQIPAGPQKQPIAVTNVTIHPVSDKSFENGTIVFSNGRIVSLGRAVEIPTDAKVIDLPGKHVYPGLIESYSRIGLTEISAVKATNDYEELGQINSNVQAELAINPESEYFPVHRANGIAMAISAPSGGILSGKSALLRMDGWTWEEMTYKAPVSMMMTWPQRKLSGRYAKGKSEDEQKKEFEKNMNLLTETFRDGRAYMTAKASGDKTEKYHHSIDLRLEALIPVLKGKLPVWIEANSLWEIEAAISWAQNQQVKIVIIGGVDASYAINLLKEKEISVIASPVLRLPSRRDADFDQPFTLPEKLYKAGITYCIASGGASGIRNLPYHAAKAAAYGLPKDEALKAITLYAAKIIGVADRLGSLEVGKDATLIVTDGDPLEITTQVTKLYIEGRDIDLNNKHKELYIKYQKRYEQNGE